MTTPVLYEGFESSDMVADRMRAADAIVDELDCSFAEAERMVKWLAPLVEKARHNPDRQMVSNRLTFMSANLSNDQLRDRSYYIFDRVIPPMSGKPLEGSAHETLEDLFLDRDSDEIGLAHFRDDRDSENCKVAIQLVVKRK